MSDYDRDFYRQVLYLFFLALFVTFIITLIGFGTESNFGFVEGLGIGSILGIMGKMLSDGWQFFFRKS